MIVRQPQEARLFVLATIIAPALIVLTLQDAFEAMLLPRRVERRVRFMSAYFSVLWSV